MEIKIYSIRDDKTEAYLTPFYSHNDTTAKRTVAISMDGEATHAKYPQDYGLYSLGSFNDQTGQLEATPPTFICNLIDLQKVIENE